MFYRELSFFDAVGGFVVVNWVFTVAVKSFWVLPVAVQTFLVFSMKLHCCAIFAYPPYLKRQIAHDSHVTPPSIGTRRVPNRLQIDACFNMLL
jgi:hypothetical protein